jgi:hypothetical protein
MPTFHPTADDVAKIMEHVRYEVTQTFVLPPHDGTNDHLRESIFLAILVHARLLLHFFEDKTRRQKDVLCSDFGFPTKPLSLAEKDRERLDKDIVHLTYSRLRHTPQTKPWPLEDILKPLHERVAEFVNHVVTNVPRDCPQTELALWRSLDEAFRNASGTYTTKKGTYVAPYTRKR